MVSKVSMEVLEPYCKSCLTDAILLYTMKVSMKPLMPSRWWRLVIMVLPKVLLQSCLAKAKRCFLAEAMLVKLPKMVAEPLMPKSLAKAMPT